MSPSGLLIGMMVWSAVMLAFMKWNGTPAHRERLRRLVSDGSGPAAAQPKWLTRSQGAMRHLFPDDGRLVTLAGLDGSLNAGNLAVVRIALGVCGACAGVGVALATRRPSGVLAFGCALTCAWLPSWLLSARARARQNRIRREFPGVVDLIALSASAGLNLDRALEVAAKLIKGELAVELGRALTEVYVGRRPIAALRSLSERTGLPEVEALVTALAQADTFGTPIAGILSNQSSVARNVFRQQTEAAVGRLPVLLTVCTLVFLFPALFVLTLLPNILTFVGSGW